MELAETNYFDCNILIVKDFLIQFINLILHW